MIRFYRVKQTAKDEYIPQVWEFPYGWQGIDREGFNYTFDLKEFQRQHCICGSLEKAKKIIGTYQEYIKESKKYPKYHKI